MTTIQYITDKLLANDPTALDKFGYSVALDGDTAVIGVRDWDRKVASGVTALSGSGCAYVFIKNGTQWNFQQQLFANDPSAQDYFGQSVAISNDTIVIGAPFWDRKVESGITALANCGCAYVFVRNDTEWGLQKKIVANDPSADDYFGVSVSISNDTIVIGASQWDRKVESSVTAISNCGCAYVFIRNGVEWSLQQQLFANDPSDFDNFGIVSISTNTIVITAYLWDRKVASGVTALSDCGCAYVFIKNEVEWSLQQQLFVNDPSANDQFGQSVSLSNNTIVVGTRNWDRKVASGVTALSDCGCAYVFIRNGTEWSLQQQLLANDPTAGDWFGWSVAVSNDIVVVGASQWDRKVASGVTALAACGAAYVFMRNGVTWTLQKKTLANDPSFNDNYGYSVAINNDTVVIGTLNWSRKAESGVTAVTGCGAAYITDLGLYVGPVVVNKNYEFLFNWEEEKVINGNIGIGTSIPNKTLDVNGDINVSNALYKQNQKLANWTKSGSNIYYNNGNIGINTTSTVAFDVNGTVRSMVRLTNSDIRLKDNIKDETLGLPHINELKPKVFSYINNNEVGKIHGFIAQEVEETSYNDIVEQDINGYYTINLESLICPLIKSIQDLSLENKILEEKINNLIEENV